MDRVRKGQALRQKAASTIGAAARGHLARKHLPQPEPEPEPEPVRALWSGKLSVVSAHANLCTGLRVGLVCPM